MPPDMPLRELITSEQAQRYIEDYLIPEAATHPSDDTLDQLKTTIDLYKSKGVLGSQATRQYNLKYNAIKKVWDQFVESTE
jgi:hypothetical protein|tara:strand:- start:139 stop:381 length:243 start_codon:yes stop_codon:yes gene_type:complete